METPDRKLRFDTAAAKLLGIVGQKKDGELLMQVKELIDEELRPIAFERDDKKNTESVLDHRDGRFLGHEE